MEAPQTLRYTSDHEWVDDCRGRSLVRVGITDFAQDALGDVVYVDLPSVGARVACGEAVGALESTKSVSDIYAPVAGVVVSVNQVLVDQPELINADPYGAGWLFELAIDGVEVAEALLDADAYQALTLT